MCVVGYMLGLCSLALQLVLAAEEDLGGVVSMFESIGALESVVARFLCGGLDFTQLLGTHPDAEDGRFTSPRSYRVRGWGVGGPSPSHHPHRVPTLSLRTHA